MADSSSRAGASYLTPDVLAYFARTHAAHDEPLERAFTAAERHPIPAIQLGPSEGKLLTVLLRLARARRVVEIGTLAGYSALRIARALPADGHLWSLELDPEHARLAREHLAAAGLASRVTVLVGPAEQSLAELAPQGPFCAVFVDADKAGYAGYGRWAAKHLRSGGLLLGDNAAYFGKLLDEGDPAAAAMRAFHEECAAQMDSVCIPTPDGLLLGVKP